MRLDPQWVVFSATARESRSKRMHANTVPPRITHPLLGAGQACPTLLQSTDLNPVDPGCGQKSLNNTTIMPLYAFCRASLASMPLDHPPKWAEVNKSPSPCKKTSTSNLMPSAQHRSGVWGAECRSAHIVFCLGAGVLHARWALSRGAALVTFGNSSRRLRGKSPSGSSREA